MDREEMRKLQSIRLRRVVEHAYHNSPFYRKKMQELGVVPQDIQSIDDITKLPFTVILFLSGLQTIDEQYYTAAKVDGAGSKKILFRITIPLLSPTIALVLIINIINSCFT